MAEQGKLSQAQRGFIVLCVLMVVMCVFMWLAAWGFSSLQWKLYLHERVASEVEKRWTEELPPNSALFFGEDGTVRWVPVDRLRPVYDNLPGGD